MATARAAATRAMSSRRRRVDPEKVQEVPAATVVPLVFNSLSGVELAPRVRTRARTV